MAHDVQASDHGSLDAGRQAELLQRAERALKRLTLLQQVTAALSEALTPGEVGAVVMGLGTNALEAHSGRISLLRPDGQTVDVVASAGYTYIRTPLSVSERLPTNEVIRTGRAMFEPRFADLMEQFPSVDQAVGPLIRGALASAPLIINGRVIGAMTLVFKGDREFDFRAFPASEKRGPADHWHGYRARECAAHSRQPRWHHRRHEKREPWLDFHRSAAARRWAARTHG